MQCQHLQVCREKWRLSVAGAAAARAEGSAWPSRYWMERSWKQGSASSTAVARSVLPRNTDLRQPTLCSHTSTPSCCPLGPGEHPQIQPKSSGHPPPLPPRLRGSRDRCGASALAEAAALGPGPEPGAAAGQLKHPALPLVTAPQGTCSAEPHTRGWGPPAPTGRLSVCSGQAGPTKRQEGGVVALPGFSGHSQGR